jgi:hypothetical protein
VRAKSESNRSGIVAFLSAFWTSFGGKYTCVSELLEKYQCTRRYSIVLELSQTKPDFNFKKSKYCSGTRSWRQQSQGPGAMGLTPDDNLTSCCCKSQLSDLISCPRLSMLISKRRISTPPARAIPLGCRLQCGYRRLYEIQRQTYAPS